ncbi:MAG: Gfo/Idh/MocA family oxidoreductase, partial [Thalassovita sp.]|nr:Gfo/Idh/MocA family oxidoreductase [Thalassovita sp.]
VITGHHRRCHPFVQATFARLERVGKPVAVQGMWSLRKHDSYYDPDWRRAPGSGPLMTNLSHEIDLMRGFLGDIDEVSALSSNATRGFVIEDTAAISIRFRNGALGSFLISDAGLSPWSFEAACGENPDVPISGQDYLRFTGTAGAMSFPSLMLWQGAGGKPATWHTQLEREACPSFDRIDPIAVQMDLFANLLEGRDSGILADGADGRATLEATLAAVLSAQMGRPVRQGEVPADYDGSSISEVT